MGIGSIVGMPFTGRLVDRYSSRAVSLVATLICLGGWATIPLARSVPALALMLLITGVGTGVGDVAMNVQGHLVETRRRKVLMPFWHGLFSLGAVSGCVDSFDGCDVVSYHALYSGRRPASEHRIGTGRRTDL